jgi:hypothetical protein
LYAYDTKSLPGGCLHHDPTLQTIDHDGTQRFQARYFRGDVVGLDVEMNSAFVIDTLDLHNRFVRRRLEHALVAACARVIGIHRTSQCGCPKAGCLIDVSGVAID